jgi:peroxiredoxin
MIKRLSLCIFAIITIAACTNNTVRISGTLNKSQKGQYIYLGELTSREIKPVDSVKLADDGKFSFKKELKAPAFYILKVSDHSFLTMLLKPGERIRMESYYDSLNYPVSIKGSEGTMLMDEYNRNLRNTINKLSGLSSIYRKNADNPNLPAIIDSLDKTAQSYLDEINQYTKTYIDRNIESLVSLIALYQQVAPNVYVLNPSKDYRYYLRVDSVLSKLYPDYEPVASLHEQVQQLKDAFAGGAEKSSPIREGAPAPEIALPTPAGDTVRLSSTRGSVVLLDFWASWCSPCRMENPNLVKAYSTYHRKGFQIFQVSLDKTKDAWVNGIKDDQLDKWIHVSDIQYWNSAAVKLYNIESIPSNFLLDREGRIIAVNLRGDALEAKLAEILK